jgi:hypothetical protein
MTIQSVPPSEKDVPKKVILEKDVPEKDVLEKDVLKKDLPEKNMPEDVPEKAINEDVKQQSITALVPVEVMPTLATWLYMWLMPGEVLRFSIRPSREMEHKRESLLTASRFVGPFAVARRLIWTWSMTDNDDISWIHLEVTYDPAMGLIVRVTFQCNFWQTTPEKGPTLEMCELIPSNSTGDCTLETLWDWKKPKTDSLSWKMVQESPDYGALIHVNVLANPSWTQITAFGKSTEILRA